MQEFYRITINQFYLVQKRKQKTNENVAMLSITFSDKDAKFEIWKL